MALRVALLCLLVEQRIDALEVSADGFFGKAMQWSRTV
jgi:hypothetical protein